MKSDRIIKEINEVKRKLRGVILVEGSKELRAGDVLCGSTLVDEGEHYVYGGRTKVIIPPAEGERREQLLKKLGELKKLYEQAVNKEKDEFIDKEADRIAKEIELTGKTTVTGFDEDFQLPPEEAEEYYRNIGNLRMAEAVRKAMQKRRGGVKR